MDSGVGVDWKDIEQLNDLCNAMAEELISLSGPPVVLERLIQALEGNEATDALVEEVRRVISLPSRVDCLERLVSAAMVLMELEQGARSVAPND